MKKTYFIDGIELSKYTPKQLQELKCSRFGIVPEKVDLIAKRTVEQNLELPLRISRLSKEERKNAIVKAVNSVGLSDKILTLKPTDLSSGQCQRVMVARAIITNPQVIIADNPTALMDEESSELILNLFTALNKGGVTIIVATRDENFLKRAKRVFTMSRGMLVENMKVTRGKNVGEVIDIDAKKKKTQKSSIKKQVIVPEKKVKVQKDEIIVVENPQKAENLKEDKKESLASETTVEKQVKSNTKTNKSESVADENNSTKKILSVSSSRKKKNNDDNQLSFDEFVGMPKNEEGVEEENPVKTMKKFSEKKDVKETKKIVAQEKKSSKKTVEAKKSEEKQIKKETSDKKPKVSKKPKEEIKGEEDSELLIKPVKSSKRKTK